MKLNHRMTAIAVAVMAAGLAGAVHATMEAPTAAAVATEDIPADPCEELTGRIRAGEPPSVVASDYLLPTVVNVASQGQGSLSLLCWSKHVPGTSGDVLAVAFFDRQAPGGKAWLVLGEKAADENGIDWSQLLIDHGFEGVAPFELGVMTSGPTEDDQIDLWHELAESMQGAG